MFVDGAARLLVFRVGTERFGINLTAVEEVVDALVVQPLPDASPTVLGVTTVRGVPAMVFDPRPLLHVGGRIDGAALLFIRDGRRIALAVDDVFDAMTVTDDEMRSPPSIGVSDGFVIGVVRRGPDLVAVLDVDVLLDAFFDVFRDGFIDATTAANADVGEKKK